MHRAVDGQPRRRQQGLVVGQERSSISEEASEPPALGQHQVDDQRVAEGILPFVLVAGPGQRHPHDGVGGLGPDPFEVPDGLAAQPAHPLGQRCLFGHAQVALLVLAARTAPAPVVAPEHVPGPAERLHGGEVLGDRPKPGAQPPQPGGAHRIAPVPGVPGQAIGGGDEASVGLDRQLEVLLRRRPVAHPLGVPGGEEARRRPVARSDRRRQERLGHRLERLRHPERAEQLVGHQPQDVEVAKVVERRPGQLVGDRFFI